MTANQLDKFLGCVVGSAVGDALGAPLEFMSPLEIADKHGRVTEMLGGGWLSLEKGEWTDDTEMSLCVLESLVLSGGETNLEDVKKRFVAWAKSGPKDIGAQTRAALLGPLPEAKSPNLVAGNGGVMRCHPIALTHLHNPARMAESMTSVCSLTHPDDRCLDSCLVTGLLIREAVLGIEWAGDELILPGQTISYLESCRKARDLTRFNAGYTYNPVALAYRAFVKNRSFEDGLIEVVNLGGDADTNGAVVGAVLGAKYGLSAIPDRWLAELDSLSHLLSLAAELYQIVQRKKGTQES